MGKYFKYAIGEIVLVVIGILIALQINNWNQKNQNNKSLNYYLIALQKENESNIKALQFYLDYLKEDVSTVNKYLTLLNTKYPDKINDSILLNLFSNLGPVRVSKLENAVYEELLNSNLLSTIEEGSFKRDLFWFKKRVELYNENTKEVYTGWNNELRPYYIKHGNIVKMRDSILHVKLPKTYLKVKKEAFINNNEFNNILVNRIMFSARVTQTINSTEKRIIDLNNRINSFLEND